MYNDINVFYETTIARTSSNCLIIVPVHARDDFLVYMIKLNFLRITDSSVSQRRIDGEGTSSQMQTCFLCQRSTGRECWIL